MRSERDEFPKSVRARAFERCKGRCECGCGKKILGTPIYDHYPTAASLGGPGTLENCRVLDPKCNRTITNKDISKLAKSQRIYEKHAGIRSPSKPMPCGRRSRFKKKMSGEIVPR